ncbi:MAG: hypothetical protein GYA34_15865 [Chloroflexi bacterium]|nr:hypothetical protein [Chloroflexota bacterium]
MMTQMIGRNIYRIMILFLAAGLVIGFIYLLSFTSTTTRFSDQSEFPGQGLGNGQSLIPPGGGEFQAPGSEGRYGFGAGRQEGYGFGRGLGEGRGFQGEEFSLARGMIELAMHSIVVIALVLFVLFIQRVVKRRQRVSNAA